MSEPRSDRYLSFCNIKCDENANQLIEILEAHLSKNHGGVHLVEYFRIKREAQKKLGHDNLNFIGQQLNVLYEYFESCGDSSAEKLLYQLEQECC